MKSIVYRVKKYLIYVIVFFVFNVFVLEWYYLFIYVYVFIGEKEKICDRKKKF